MRKLLIATAASLLIAAPAAAQGDPLYEDDPVYEAELDADIAAAIPPGEEIEAMAPMVDRMAGALLDVDVGPVLDAADPYRRHYWRGRRTLGELAGRDDPYFEARLRDSIYGTTAGMAAMMDAFAAATPAVRRSLREAERAIDRAVRESRYRDRYDDDRWDD